FVKATLTYENGTVKEGFVEMVEATDSKVKFRATEKGDTEKILSSELKKIVFNHDDGSTSIAEKLFINKVKGEDEVKKSKKQYWLYVVYSHGIKIAVDIAISTFRYNAISGTSTGMGGATMLHVGKEKDDGVYFVFPLEDMMSINIGMDRSVRKRCAFLFKDCPKFLEAVNNENFKKPTLINRLIELYETNNCNKPVQVKKEEKNKKVVSKKKK
ncbi:hypothetical protein, partial [Flavobacterium sp.]|uniref:hypothetical protein n=1 Tax=Flavobacterium sp. TaxID=239 RepID=UPI003C3F2C6C